MVQRGADIRRGSPPRKLHRLRIKLKRLRYQLEFLLDAYGKPARKTYKALCKLQTLLGKHQDAYVALAALQAYGEHTNLGRVERRTFNTLAAHEQERADAYRAQFRKRWRRFEEASQQLLQRL